MNNKVYSCIIQKTKFTMFMTKAQTKLDKVYSKKNEFVSFSGLAIELEGNLKPVVTT